MEYTGNDLLKKSMSLMGEESKYKSGYTPFVTDIVNQLLAECFDVNNTIRQSAGKTPLLEIPTIEKETDVIGYEYQTVVNIMVYGLAYWLLFQDDEYDKANACNALYGQGKISYAKAAYADVENCYR